MSRLLLATRNSGKLRELRSLLGGEAIELVALDECPEIGEIEETGRTFEENAALKAAAAARASRCFALGEDSGLEVDALGGAPGVYSARFAGRHGDDEANNRKLIRDLRGKENRVARYVCAMVLADPSGEVIATTRGVCEGRIRDEPKGHNGFGYDPYFVPDAARVTMAELEPQMKDAISHRGQALRAMVGLLHLHLGRAEEPAAPLTEPTVR